MTASTTSDAIDYPIRFDIAHQPQQSRLTNFPLGIGAFIRAILLIPHFIILYFLEIVFTVLYFIGTFAVLFTGRFPEGMLRFNVGFLRWSANVYGYLASMYDDYPPFSTDQQAGYPLTFHVDSPARLSRLLNFPLFIGLFIKAILLIPHFIIVYFLILAAFVVVVIAQFAILFTGTYPQGMHGFVTGVGRWNMRMQGYLFALTDKYPPFSTN